MRRQGRTGGFLPFHDKPHISALFARSDESITHSRLLPHLTLYSALRSVYSELIDVSQAPASSPAPRRRSRAKDPHPPPSTTARPGRPAPAPEPRARSGGGGGDPRRPTAPCRPAAPGGSEGGTVARGGRAVVTQVPPGRVAGRQHQGSHGPGSPPRGPEPHHRGGQARTRHHTAGQRRTSAPEGARTGTRGPEHPTRLRPRHTPVRAETTAQADRPRLPPGGPGPVSRTTPQPPDPTHQHPTGADDMETGGTSHR